MLHSQPFCHAKFETLEHAGPKVTKTTTVPSDILPFRDELGGGGLDFGAVLEAGVPAATALRG